MADREQPYDPYIPSGGNASQQQNNGNQRTQALQAVGSALFLAATLHRRGSRNDAAAGAAGHSGASWAMELCHGNSRSMQATHGTKPFLRLGL